MSTWVYFDSSFSYFPCLIVTRRTSDTISMTYLFATLYVLVPSSVQTRISSFMSRGCALDANNIHMYVLYRVAGFHRPRNNGPTQTSVSLDSISMFDSSQLIIIFFFSFRFSSRRYIVVIYPKHWCGRVRTAHFTLTLNRLSPRRLG